MRAVSLSDGNVQRILRDHFICATVNLKGNPQAGFSFEHSPKEPARPVPAGLGEHNNQILILTPAGEIINARAGYVGPRELIAELEFSRRLMQRLVASKDRKQTVVAAHKDFLRNPPPGLPPRVRIKIPGAKKAIVKGAGRAVLDHEFVIAHPLLPVGEFTIAKMIGEAPRTLFFFGQEVLPRKKR